MHLAWILHLAWTLHLAWILHLVWILHLAWIHIHTFTRCGSHAYSPPVCDLPTGGDALDSVDVGQSMECLDTHGCHVDEGEFVAIVQAGRLQESHSDVGFLHHLAQGAEWSHTARAVRGDRQHEHIKHEHTKWDA